MIKILPFIKIYEFGISSLLIEDNEYFAIKFIFSDKDKQKKFDHVSWYSFKPYSGNLRKNGPALHSNDYSWQVWYQSIEYRKHRLDGPQIIYSNNEVEYWVCDKFVGTTEEEFIKYKKRLVLL